MRKWTVTDIPDQKGRTAIITGANTGLGFETATALAVNGARVVLAVRNLEKGENAIRRIRAAYPAAQGRTASSRFVLAGVRPRCGRGAHIQP